MAQQASRGVISAANSLVGTSTNDLVGSGEPTILKNGNYVISSQNWDNDLQNAVDAGAVTFGNAVTGIKGAVTSANSLAGGTTSDFVGNAGVTTLTNSNYVVNSTRWDNLGIADAGAATFGNGTTGIKGLVSPQNSLVGSSVGDSVGYAIFGGIRALTNGNYVVCRSGYVVAGPWDNGSLVDAGAVTFGSGVTGVKGAITGSNSFVGGTANTYLVVQSPDNVNGTFLARFRAEGSGIVRIGSQTDGFKFSPQITEFAGEVTFTENAVPLILAPGAVVTDIDTPILVGGKLTLEFTSGAGADDRLAIRNAGSISTSGSSVLYAGNVMGSFTGGTGTTPLVVTLNSMATPGKVQALLRNVTYINVSDAPSTLNRSVKVTLTDGKGGTSVPRTKIVKVAAVNDVPLLENGSAIAYTENAPAITINSLVSVTDLDHTTLSTATIRVTNFVAAEDVLSFTSVSATMGNIALISDVGGVMTLASGGATGTLAEWQNALRSVRYRNTSDKPTTTQRSITFVVSDGTNNSNALTNSIKITTVSDTPRITDASTRANSQSTSGLVITRNSGDGAEVTHFRISGIAGGTVFQNNGTTPIGNGAFITAAQGNAGLKFIPSQNSLSTGHFAVQASTSNSNIGLGGDVVVADIVVTPAPIGTTRNDAFVLTYSVASATATVRLTISTNGGAVVDFGTFPMNVALNLIGSGGTDSVRIVGTNGADTITVSSTGLTINTARLGLTSIEVKTLAGALGNDIYKFDADAPLGLFTLDESFGGNDTIDFSLTTAVGVSLNLGAAGTQVVNSTTLRLNLLSGSSLENAIGGSGNDTLTGNNLANKLTGNGGSDRLTGAGGNDSLIGGPGNDFYIFATATTAEADTVTELMNGGTDTLDFFTVLTAVSVNLTTGDRQTVQIRRSLQIIGVTAMENVTGGVGSDHLTGNSLNNALTGNPEESECAQRSG